MLCSDFTLKNFDTEIVKSLGDVKFSNKRWVVPNAKMDSLKEKLVAQQIIYHEDLYDVKKMPII